MPCIVATLYKFTAIDNPPQLRAKLLAVLTANRVRGTILLAAEGINGTICGTRDGIDAVLAWLKRQSPQSMFADITARESQTDTPPFKRMRVKLKKEIVTMGVADLDANCAGARLSPREWNALLDEDDVLVVDVRNEYEINIGAFAGAINPHTVNFREFPAFAEKNLAAHKDKKIAMYCTGGIRCEKSTAYLKSRGFAHVFHLSGGILNYLESTAAHESKWRGQCFVFDERVAVDENLNKGDYAQCHACRWPISQADMASEKYQRGVSCPHCYDRTADRARFAERQKQVELAAARDAVHLGPQAMPLNNVGE